ncbi:MAG: MFS transporter [Saprospiraceae bacterium]|nr:MFS transporter [Saprospiraceae bacterium]
MDRHLYRCLLHTIKKFFYFLAIMVGMVMGGIQSLSRASYSSLITEKSDSTSFFSLMDVIYKTAIVTGTFFFWSR